jgi:hypothetical protein
MAIKINDRVCSRNQTGTAANVPGTVVAIFQADFYKWLAKQVHNLDTFTTWDRLYPNWQEKCIIKVKLDEPKPSATLQEWVESATAQGFRPGDAAESYHQQCPVVHSMDFPEDDLILLEFDVE